MAVATPAGATTLWSDHESLAPDAREMGAGGGAGLLPEKVNAARVALARACPEVERRDLQRHWLRFLTAWVVKLVKYSAKKRTRTNVHFRIPQYQPHTSQSHKPRSAGG